MDWDNLFNKVKEYAFLAPIISAILLILTIIFAEQTVRLILAIIFGIVGLLTIRYQWRTNRVLRLLVRRQLISIILAFVISVIVVVLAKLFSLICVELRAINIGISENRSTIIAIQTIIPSFTPTPTLTKEPSATPITPTPTPTATTTHTPSGTPTQKVFEDDFNRQFVDELKWTRWCSSSEAGIESGQLIFNVPKDGEESCVFKAKISSGAVITKITFELTIERTTNQYGFIGLFTSCGNNYLNITGNSDFIYLIEQDTEPIEIDATNDQFPFTTLLTLEETAENVFSAISINSITGKPSSEEVKCYGELSNIRFGTDRNIEYEGTVYGKIDNIVIWGILP